MKYKSKEDFTEISGNEGFHTYRFLDKAQRDEMKRLGLKVRVLHGVERRERGKQMGWDLR